MERLSSQIMRRDLDKQPSSSECPESVTSDLSGIDDVIGRKHQGENGEMRTTNTRTDCVYFDELVTLRVSLFYEPNERTSH